MHRKITVRKRDGKWHVRIPVGFTNTQLAGVYVAWSQAMSLANFYALESYRAADTR